MHEIIQKSKKTFECLYCDKTFAQKVIMKKCERIHTNENLKYVFFARTHIKNRLVIRSIRNISLIYTYVGM